MQILRYTKLGYSDNSEPQFILPSAIAVKERTQNNLNKNLANDLVDLDFFIGDEALSPSAVNYSVKVNFYNFYK